MTRRKNIKFIFGISLLLLFALSNTPTRVLHHLFANHTDTNYYSSNYNQTELLPGGIDCHCNSNVVIAPYLAGEVVEVHPVSKAFVPYYSTFRPGIVLLAIVAPSLRGPPVHV